MAEGQSWNGDWHARIYARARAKGYDAVTRFAEDRPRSPLLALADELGREDVNAAQILSILRAEAERGAFVDRFARSLLVHELHEAIPRGWRVDDDEDAFTFRVSGPFTTLITALPESHQPLARELARAMMAADLPRGWLPDGPDDPILVDFFRRAAAGSSLEPATD